MFISKWPGASSDLFLVIQVSPFQGGIEHPGLADRIEPTPHRIWIKETMFECFDYTHTHTHTDT